VIDCSPEGFRPKVNTRVFEGVKHEVCIVLASRSPDNDPVVPAKVRFRALANGHRLKKFEELSQIALASGGWQEAAPDWRAPFLPQFAETWADFVPLDKIIGDSGSGVMPGRTWVIAPDAMSLRDRWEKLLRMLNSEQRGSILICEMGNRVTGTSKKLAGVCLRSKRPWYRLRRLYVITAAQILIRGRKRQERVS
jgi:hypothetical protein